MHSFCLAVKYWEANDRNIYALNGIPERETPRLQTGLMYIQAMTHVNHVLHGF